MRRKWFCFALCLILAASTMGCGKKNIFSQQTIPVIVSTELEIKDVIRIQSKTSYDEKGMPVSRTSMSQPLYDETLPVQYNDASFAYDEKERSIRTTGLSMYLMDDGTWASQSETYWFDTQGRLLKTENAHDTYTYSYDETGRMTVSYGKLSNNSITSDTQYSFGEAGLQKLDQKLDEVSHSIQGTYEHNARGDLTYSYEIIDTDQPEYKYHTEKSLTCSYDAKGRVISQTVSYKDMDGNSSQEEMVFSYEGDSFDVKSIDIPLSGRHIEFTYEYEKGRLKTMTVTEEDTVTTETFTYDPQGRIIKKEMASEAFYEAIEFEHKSVSDPVIASFLRLKTDYLTHQDNDFSLFVLQTDQNRWNEHYCYMCGRTLLYPYQTCPYCGTKVNCTAYYENTDCLLPPTVGMAHLWSVDGNLIH